VILRYKKCKESKDTYKKGIDLLGTGTFYSGYLWEYHFDYANNCETNPSLQISEYQESLKYAHDDRTR
jgi:hypothetical protein